MQISLEIFMLWLSLLLLFLLDFSIVFIAISLHKHCKYNLAPSSKSWNAFISLLLFLLLLLLLLLLRAPRAIAPAPPPPPPPTEAMQRLASLSAHICRISFGSQKKIIKNFFLSSLSHSFCLLHSHRYSLFCCSCFILFYFICIFAFTPRSAFSTLFCSVFLPCL